MHAQEAYKAELAQAYGITFNSLLCLNNMPIKRYVDYLQRKGQLGSYMQLLLESFNAGAAEAVMCRGTVSVGWDGRVYDCDFNQQLELGLRSARVPSGGPLWMSSFLQNLAWLHACLHCTLPIRLLCPLTYLIALLLEPCTIHHSESALLAITLIIFACGLCCREGLRKVSCG